MLGVAPGKRPGRSDQLVGNVLAAEAVAQVPTLNFVDDAAYQAAMRRADEVQAEGGTLEVDRLFHNLLSSMPMCFNLFGSLAAKPGCLDIVRGLFETDAAAIDEVVCEVTPTRSLGDRTAFDAMIGYRDADDRPRFIGIETKYTEPFSPTRYDNDTYRSVTADSGWFRDGAADALVEAKTNQLWRGLMLAALTERDTGATGNYAVVSTADDTTAIATTELVAAQLVDPTRLRFVSIDSIVDLAGAHPDPPTGEWARAFRRRYLLSDESLPPRR